MSQEYDFDADERRYEEERDREAERHFSSFENEVIIEKIKIQFNGKLSQDQLNHIAKHTAEIVKRHYEEWDRAWSVEIKGIYAEIHDWAGRHTGIVFNYTQ